MEHVTTCHLWFRFRVAGSNWAVGKCGTRDTGWSGGATRLLGAQFLLFQKVCTVRSCQETSNWYSILVYLYELYYVIKTIHKSLWVFCILNAYLEFSACSQQWAAASCIRMVWCVRVSRVMVWRSPMRLGLCWIPVSLQMNTFCWIFHSCSMCRLEQKACEKCFIAGGVQHPKYFRFQCGKEGIFSGFRVETLQPTWISYLDRDFGPPKRLVTCEVFCNPLYRSTIRCNSLLLDGFLKSGFENHRLDVFETM